VVDPLKRAEEKLKQKEEELKRILEEERLQREAAKAKPKREDRPAAPVSAPKTTGGWRNEPRATPAAVQKKPAEKTILSKPKESSWTKPLVPKSNSKQEEEHKETQPEADIATPEDTASPVETADANGATDDGWTTVAKKR
jgi:hypothetical protein